MLAALGYTCLICFLWSASADVNVDHLHVSDWRWRAILQMCQDGFQSFLESKCVCRESWGEEGWVKRGVAPPWEEKWRGFPSPCMHACSFWVKHLFILAGHHQAETSWAKTTTTKGNNLWMALEMQPQFCFSSLHVKWPIGLTLAAWVLMAWMHVAYITERRGWWREAIKGIKAPWAPYTEHQIIKVKSFTKYKSLINVTIIS